MLHFGFICTRVGPHGWARTVPRCKDCAMLHESTLLRLVQTCERFPFSSSSSAPWQPLSPWISSVLGFSLEAGALFSSPDCWILESSRWVLLNLAACLKLFQKYWGLSSKKPTCLPFDYLLRAVIFNGLLGVSTVCCKGLQSRSLEHTSWKLMGIQARISKWTWKASPLWTRNCGVLGSQPFAGLSLGCSEISGF